jgi:hypothetical protein
MAGGQSWTMNITFESCTETSQNHAQKLDARWEAFLLSILDRYNNVTGTI